MSEGPIELPAPVGPQEVDQMEVPCPQCGEKVGGHTAKQLGECKAAWDAAQPQQPVIMKSRAILRDTMRRLMRTGEMLVPEGIGLVLICPECRRPIGMGLDEMKQIVELRCACTVWTVRSISV